MIQKQKRWFIAGAMGLGLLGLSAAVTPERNITMEATEKTTMQTLLHKANTRGEADHGWLYSRHTFSFGNYFDPERVGFGTLRVLNDDQVAAGRGFGTHPHENMEIISIPLSGDLKHKDSMGNEAIIKNGDVQVMSAGTGVFHSEYNANDNAEVKFLQIWVFPNKHNVDPRYDQFTLDPEKLNNNLFPIISPNAEDEGVWIHQNAWFHMGDLKEGFETTYKLKDPRNGVYAFVIEGDVTLGDQALNRRDGLGIVGAEEFSVKANSDGRLLLMEVPMARY